MKTILKLTCAKCEKKFEREKRQVKNDRAFCTRSCGISFYSALRYPKICGSYGSYRLGCRCDKCKSANSERMRLYRFEHGGTYRS